MLGQFETTIDVIILTETWFIERLCQEIDGYVGSRRLPHVQDGGNWRGCQFMCDQLYRAPSCRSSHQ